MPTQVALFIDADNAPASQIPHVIESLFTYGTITTRKAFGNWKKPCLKPWARQLKKHTIQPIQQFDVTKQLAVLQRKFRNKYFLNKGL